MISSFQRIENQRSWAQDRYSSSGSLNNHPRPLRLMLLTHPYPSTTPEASSRIANNKHITLGFFQPFYIDEIYDIVLLFCKFNLVVWALILLKLHH